MDVVDDYMSDKVIDINKFLANCSYKEDGVRVWYGRAGVCCNFLREYTRNYEGCKNCVYNMGGSNGWRCTRQFLYTMGYLC